jgi:hypothetical protein
VERRVEDGELLVEAVEAAKTVMVSLPTPSTPRSSSLFVETSRVVLPEFSDAEQIGLGERVAGKLRSVERTATTRLTLSSFSRMVLTKSAQNAYRSRRRLARAFTRILRHVHRRTASMCLIASSLKPSAPVSLMIHCPHFMMSAQASGCE